MLQLYDETADGEPLPFAAMHCTNWMHMLVTECFEMIDESKCIADWSAKHYVCRQEVTVWVTDIAELHNSSQKAVSVQDSC